MRRPLRAEVNALAEQRSHADLVGACARPSTAVVMLGTVVRNYNLACGAEDLEH